MILAAKIVEQLRARSDELRDFDHARRDEAREYGEALTELASLTRDGVLARLGNAPHPGAIPGDEFEASLDFAIPFPHDFRNHHEARQWAGKILDGHPTVAVDGSQIPPPSDLRLPVAAVQAAWFENRHTPDGQYGKEIEFEILTPVDLRLDQGGEEAVSTEQLINLRRFELEMRTLVQRVQALAAAPNSGRPVALIDSSLVISFSDRLPGELRARYVAALHELLTTARDLSIPIVGYVAGSRARDLTSMLELAFKLPPARRVDDASLLTPRLAWGWRTPLLICARGSANPPRPGILESLKEFERGIGFTYLKTSATTPPARLEIPLWIAAAGWLDEVIDLVRAEVIVGNGYPYAIAAADAAAAISGRERDQFHAICNKFMAEHGILTPPSPKSISKERRR